VSLGKGKPFKAEGFRRYDLDEDVDRVSRKILGTVLDVFRRDRVIREKYDVVNRSAEVRVIAGYAPNMIGFGWTNGTFLELLDGLSEASRNRLQGRQGPAAPRPGAWRGSGGRPAALRLTADPPKPQNGTGQRRGSRRCPPPSWH
jgi:hypothetical protein